MAIFHAACLAAGFCGRGRFGRGRGGHDRRRRRGCLGEGWCGNQHGDNGQWDMGTEGHKRSFLSVDGDQLFQNAPESLVSLRKTVSCPQLRRFAQQQHRAGMTERTEIAKQ